MVLLMSCGSAGAPDEECRTGTLHVVAQKLLWGEEGRKFLQGGCKGVSSSHPCLPRSDPCSVVTPKRAGIQGS